MALNPKRPLTEPEYQDTVVWQCTSCICWSRKEFISNDKPICPLCGSKMIEEIKRIQIIGKPNQRPRY